MQREHQEALLAEKEKVDARIAELTAEHLSHKETVGKLDSRMGEEAEMRRRTAIQNIGIVIRGVCRNGSG